MRAAERASGAGGVTTLMHWRASVADEAVDHELVDFLEAAWQGLRSNSRLPPDCPRCGKSGASSCGADKSGLPQFLCPTCRRRFNRLTGTPMSRLRPEPKLRAFFAIVAYHWSIADAARHIGVRTDTIYHWSLQTRLWLLELDPSGAWERRIQLGVHYRLGQPLQTRGAKCRCSPTSSSGSSTEDGLLRICADCERGEQTIL